MIDIAEAPRAHDPGWKTVAFTLCALGCFALNSLICRAALGANLIDAQSFTLARLLSGAAVLLIWVWAGRTTAVPLGTSSPNRRNRVWPALALFLYALPFSLAYLRLGAGTGAFVVFGCVQITMIGSDLLSGRRLGWREATGVSVALIGLAWLTRAGAGSPDLWGVLLMAVAGFSWGLYSVQGRTSGPPVEATARNFAASVPLAVIASLLAAPNAHVTGRGLVLAIVSGSITSGLGYVAWYAALPSLGATLASIVQLSVPPLVATFGILFLGEALTPRFLVSAPLILGGIALAVSRPRG